MHTAQEADMDQLVNDLTKRARALRTTEKRLKDQRAELDELILQAMERDLTWTALQQLTGLSQATLNAARKRAEARRAAPDGTAAPAPRGS